jgi:hypothetical protein
VEYPSRNDFLKISENDITLPLFPSNHQNQLQSAVIFIRVNIPADCKSCKDSILKMSPAAYLSSGSRDKYNPADTRQI